MNHSRAKCHHERDNKHVITYFKNYVLILKMSKSSWSRNSSPTSSNGGKRPQTGPVRRVFGSPWLPVWTRWMKGLSNCTARHHQSQNTPSRIPAQIPLKAWSKNWKAPLAQTILLVLTSAYPLDHRSSSFTSKNVASTSHQRGPGSNVELLLISFTIYWNQAITIAKEMFSVVMPMNVLSQSFYHYHFFSKAVSLLFVPKLCSSNFHSVQWLVGNFCDWSFVGTFIFCGNCSIQLWEHWTMKN